MSNIGIILFLRAFGCESLWSLLKCILVEGGKPAHLCFPNARLPLRLPATLLLLPFQRGVALGATSQMYECLSLLGPQAKLLSPVHLLALIKASEGGVQEEAVRLLVQLGKSLTARRAFQLALEAIPLLKREDQVSLLFPLLFTPEHVAELANLIKARCGNEESGKGQKSEMQAYQGELLTLMTKVTGLFAGLTPHLDRQQAFQLLLQLVPQAPLADLLPALKGHYQVRNDEIFHWQQAQLAALPLHSEADWLALLSLDVHLILARPAMPLLSATFWRGLWGESAKARQLPRLLPLLFQHARQLSGVFPFMEEGMIPTPLILNTLLPMLPNDSLRFPIACQLLWQSDQDEQLLERLEEMLMAGEEASCLGASLLDCRPTPRLLAKLSTMRLQGDVAVKVAYHRGQCLETTEASCLAWPALSPEMRTRWLQEHLREEAILLPMVKHPRFADLVDYPAFFQLLLQTVEPRLVFAILMETPVECLEQVPVSLLSGLDIDNRLQVMLRGGHWWQHAGLLEGLDQASSALVRLALRQVPVLPKSQNPKLAWVCQVEAARRNENSSLSLPADLSLIEADDLPIIAQHAAAFASLHYEQGHPLWLPWLSLSNDLDRLRPHWNQGMVLKRFVQLMEKDLDLEAFLIEIMRHSDPVALLTALLTFGRDKLRLELSGRLAYRLMQSSEQVWRGRITVQLVYRLVLIKGIWPLPDLLPLLDCLVGKEAIGECLLAMVNHYPHYYHPRLLQLIAGMLTDDYTPKILQQLTKQEELRWDLLGYPLILHALQLTSIPRNLEMAFFGLMSLMNRHKGETCIWEHINRLARGPVERARWKRLHSEWKRTFVQL